MNKIALFSIGFCVALVNVNVQAQTSSNMGTIPGQPVDIKSGAGTVLTQLRSAPPEAKGTVYLEPHWTLADIKFSGTGPFLKDCSMKYNLQNKDLEILHQNEVKVLPWRRVAAFYAKPAGRPAEKYVNASRYFFGDIPLEGFLMVLDSNKWELLERAEVKTIEPSYNPALDIGEKSDQYVKRVSLLLAKDGKIYEVELRTKKFAQQFGNKQEQVLTFMKKERINLKNREDLQKLFKFLNENV